jgi:hypothetical protein
MDGSNCSCALGQAKIQGGSSLHIELLYGVQRHEECLLVHIVYCA